MKLSKKSNLGNSTLKELMEWKKMNLVFKNENRDIWSKIINNAINNYKNVSKSNEEKDKAIYCVNCCKDTDMDNILDLPCGHQVCIKCLSNCFKEPKYVIKCPLNTCNCVLLKSQLPPIEKLSIENKTEKTEEEKAPNSADVISLITLVWYVRKRNFCLEFGQAPQNRQK